jgi:hypothetical protein
MKMKTVVLALGLIMAAPAYAYSDGVSCVMNDASGEIQYQYFVEWGSSPETAVVFKRNLKSPPCEGMCISIGEEATVNNSGSQTTVRYEKPISEVEVGEVSIVEFSLVYDAKTLKGVVNKTVVDRSPTQLEYIEEEVTCRIVD